MAAQRVGEMLASEGHAQDVDVVLGPTVNLHRSPLGGRLFEAYAEDPLLSGRLAAAYIRGIQRYGIGACVKHYVANESETERRTVNVRVAKAALRELYLLPFEICVADAHPWTIMAAYNTVNGAAATEQHELNNGVLKAEWGWDGLLISGARRRQPRRLQTADLILSCRGRAAHGAIDSWQRCVPARYRRRRLMIIWYVC
jgi:beta-glucosidase